MAEALGVSFDRAYYFDPWLRRDVDARCHQYAEGALKDLDVLYTESNLGRKAWFDRNQVLVGGIQPNLILGLLLGAEFIPAPRGDADISPACWAKRPIERLPPPDTLPDHPIIRQFDDQVRGVRRDGSLTPIPPFFWDASARAAIHGALTTAHKFFGDQFFMDLLTEPDRVWRVMDWITAANLVLVQHYADLCGIEIQGVHVGECSSCMVGRGPWEAFVVPTLQRIGSELGPVRLHSCGRSDHILEAARKVVQLYSLDLGGETSLARVRELFGRHLPVSIAPQARLLTNGNLDELTAWTELVLEDNQGGELVILFHIEPQYPLATLRAWRTWLLKTVPLAQNRPPN
ncbi:MAG: hypothetical protein ABSG53_05285 [Thermoguttaceae bacterium]